MLLFYRIGSPYDSVLRMEDQVWAGRWIRALHRYASDLSIVAVLVHAARMFLQGRSWGPRALAWISGVVLVGTFLVCGWTGFVMVWDTQAQVLAIEGARFLDVLPIFSEPLARTFVGERALPAAFFFLNLFLHIALPIGVALLLWIHVSRLARPVLLPPKGLLWGTVGMLLLASVLVPASIGPEADLFREPASVPLDLFYSFFLPFTTGVPAGAVWAGIAATALLTLSVPLWTRPRPERRPPPSVVDERLCTGCEQCFVDCPYEAISMVARADGRLGLVGRVDPSLCVSCGICSGSCAPMGVGPALRTGRDQLREVQAFIEEHHPGPGDVVVVACDRGSGGVGRRDAFEGAPVFSVACAGSMHSSLVEYLVRGGAGGVLVVSCPPRDCWNREGPGWLEQRFFHDREAELQARVDRRRVCVAFIDHGDRKGVRIALRDFRTDLQPLPADDGEEVIDLERACETASPGAGVSGP